MDECEAVNSWKSQQDVLMDRRQRELRETPRLLTPSEERAV